MNQRIITATGKPPRIKVIPAHHTFDEGKKGPWLKVSWDEAHEIAAGKLPESVQNDAIDALRDRATL